MDCSRIPRSRMISRGWAFLIRTKSVVNAGWIKQLRATLDANGLQKVQIVAADEWGGAWNIVTNSSYGLLADTALSNALSRVGVHYPHSISPTQALTCGKPLWSSEDGIAGSSWAADAIFA